MTTMIVARQEARNASEPYPTTMPPAVPTGILREPKRVLLGGDIHMRTEQAEYLIRMARAEGCIAIVQLGDFGFWAHQEEGMKFLRKVNTMLEREDIDLYWIDGNHDNHSLLWQYPHPLRGGWPMIAPRIFYIPRGTRWTWRGVRFLGVGGGFSIDRDGRLQSEAKKKKPHTLWWPQETITDEQVEAAGTDPVDVLLSHDCPWLVKLPFVHYKDDLETEMNRRQLLKIAEATNPSLIVHGHYHERFNTWLESWTIGRAVPVKGLGRDGMREDSWIVLDLENPDLHSDSSSIPAEAMTDLDLATKLVEAEKAESDDAVYLLAEACFRAGVPLDESEQGLSKTGAKIVDKWIARVTEVEKNPLPKTFDSHEKD